VHIRTFFRSNITPFLHAICRRCDQLRWRDIQRFNYSTLNYEKFGNGELKALASRIAFSFEFFRAEKIAKNPAMCFVIAIRCRFCVHSSDIPRPAKLREKRLRPSEQEVGGMELEVARETRSKMGLELQISLFSVSLRSLRSHRSISPLLHRPSARSLWLRNVYEIHIAEYVLKNLHWTTNRQISPDLNLLRS